MGRDIAISGWSEQWLNRSLPELHCETTVVVYAITLASLFIGLRGLFRVRRTRKELDANPSDRAAILSDCDKRMAKSTKALFFLAHLYLIHSLALWVIDAVISVSYVYQDVNANPEEYTAPVWIDLAIQSVGMLAIFIAVFTIFPMLQIMGVAYLVKRNLPKSGDTTLAPYICEGRIITTHLAQLWMMVGFCIVSWWPVMEGSLLRLVILEAVFGSGLAWLHASFAFNFRSEALSKVQLQQPVGVSQHVQLYGKQVAASFTNEKSQLLPRYEDDVQDEKTGL